MSRQAAGRLGLTIGELVIAIGLLAMALVTTMVLFGQILDVTSKNSLLAQGSYLADSLLEIEAKRLRDHERGSPVHEFPPPGRQGSAANGTEGIPFRDEANKVDYVYKVESAALTNDNYSSADAGVSYWVRVQVRWWSDGTGQSSTRSSYGNLSVKRVRVVYVQKRY